LRKNFPIVIQLQKNYAEVKFEKDKTPILQSASSANEGFEFKTKDNAKTFGITGDTLSYTVTGPTYQNYESAFKEIKQEIFPIMEELGIINFFRIAIRKINLIEPKENHIPVENLLSVFNEELVYNFKAFPNMGSITSGVANVKMEDSDKRLNISYGLISPNDKKKKPQLLLDIDLILFNQNIGFDSIESKWKEIKDEIFNIFCWAISKGIKKDIS